MVGGRVPLLAASQSFIDGRSCTSWETFVAVLSRFRSSTTSDNSISNLFLVSFLWISCSSCCVYCLDFVTRHLMLRRRRQFVLRPSQILTPSCNFVLTGTGIATLIRQNILEFLAVGSCAIHNLCNCSTATFAATVNWTQVDTPSVADDPDSDDN